MRKFKRVLLVCFCAIIVLGSFCSCNSDKNEATPRVLADGLKAQLEEDIVWTELTPDKVAVYFGFSGEKAKECAVFINDSEDRLDTVSFFDFKTAEDKTEAIKELNVALTKAAENYKNVAETEVLKIQKRLVYEKDNRLCLVITALPEKAVEFLEEKGFSQIK